MLPQNQQEVLLDLVEYALKGGEGEEWKFFYSPVFGQIEAIHPNRRKTFQKNIPFEAIRQWHEGQLIQIIGSHQEFGREMPEPPATVGFILLERALEYYADHHYPAYLKPFIGLRRLVGSNADRP